MVAALDDDAHVAEQHAALCRPPRVAARGAGGAGFRIDHSEASLYLWATSGRGLLGAPSAGLADLGILVAPGEFYGAAGRQHVRVAFTATDERVAAAVARLAGEPGWSRARPAAGWQHHETPRTGVLDMRVTVLGTGIMGSG